jgi:hypothetical protein
MRWLIACAIAVLTVAACGEEQPACFVGEYRSCACATGAAGYQRCVSSDGYGACVCDGTTPGVDASALPEASVDAGSDAGLLPFLSACQTNEQCASGLCFPFNAKGPRCSKACKVNEDCEAPSTGCNNQGVCKAP